MITINDFSKIRELKAKNVKSYATRETLLKKLEEMGFADCRGVVCMTVEGRWTFIFAGFVQEALHSGFMMLS